MYKYYFTYGTDPAYPFRGGWTLIETDLDKYQACLIFKAYHPCRDGSVALNCCSVYEEEDFSRTSMCSENDNLGHGCWEKIKAFKADISE